MNKHLLLIPGAMLMFFGGWYFSLGKPMAESMKEIENQICAEDQKLTTYQEALARSHEQIEAFHKHKNESHNRPVIPFSGEDEMIALYTALDSLCHEPGYNLHEITPSLEETIRFLRQWARADTSLSMPIRIKIDSGYRRLARLIESIEAHRYFNRMQACRLYGSDQLYPDCALDVSFTARLGNRMELFDLE